MKKNYRTEKKKISVKACTKPLLWDANYDHENEYRHKWSKVGPSHLLREHGDPFYCFFFDTMLGRGHSGKIPKKSSVTFISKKPP